MQSNPSEVTSLGSDSIIVRADRGDSIFLCMITDKQEIGVNTFMCCHWDSCLLWARTIDALPGHIPGTVYKLHLP